MHDVQERRNQTGEELVLPSGQARQASSISLSNGGPGNGSPDFHVPMEEKGIGSSRLFHPAWTVAAGILFISALALHFFPTAAKPTRLAWRLWGAGGDAGQTEPVRIYAAGEEKMQSQG